MKVVIPLLVLAIVCTIAFAWRRSRRSTLQDRFVTVYDFETKQRSTIPAAELAPGMIRVKLETGEIVWVKVTDLKQGPVRHPPFEGKLRELVLQIQTALEEVYPRSYEFWEDGFRRDANAEQEIAVWLHISSIHREFVQSKATGLAERKEAFQILVACSSGTKETALQTVQLQHLDRSDAQVLVQKFFPTRAN